MLRYASGPACPVVALALRGAFGMAAGVAGSADPLDDAARCFAPDELTAVPREPAAAPGESVAVGDVARFLAVACAWARVGLARSCRAPSTICSYLPRPARVPSTYPVASPAANVSSLILVSLEGASLDSPPWCPRRAALKPVRSPGVTPPAAEFVIVQGDVVRLRERRGWSMGTPVRAGGALILLLVLGPLGACTSDAPAKPPPSPLVTDPTDFSRGPVHPSSSGDAAVSVSTIARHLDIPWGVTFLPDGGALVTERRTLRILKVGPGRAGNGTLTVTPVAKISEATADNEGGLLGIAASPRYALDQTVYIYYTTGVDNRIAKLRLNERPKPIVTGIPRGGIHDGGRLAFGPDGYLYASTGEASHTEGAQQLGSLGGKILRMTVDGRPAPGNPFRGSLVWSYGHRNPEGMAWGADGTMYVSEIGEAVWDELNVIRPGGNYGWPLVEGIGGKPQYVDPIVAWHPEVGVSAGVAVVGDTAIVTCLRGQRIYLVGVGGTPEQQAGSRPTEGGEPDTWGIRWRPGAGVTGRPMEALATQYGRLRTAIAAPDGSVWLTTSNRDGRNPNGPTVEDDRILRLTLHPVAAPGPR